MNRSELFFMLLAITIFLSVSVSYFGFNAVASYIAMINPAVFLANLAASWIM